MAVVESVLDSQVVITIHYCAANLAPGVGASLVGKVSVTGTSRDNGSGRACEIDVVELGSHDGFVGVQSWSGICQPSDPRHILNHLVDRQDVTSEDDAEEDRDSAVS